MGHQHRQPGSSLVGQWLLRLAGAALITLSRTVATQRANALAESEALGALLGERFEGTRPVHADRPPDADRLVLDLGGRRLEIRFSPTLIFPAMRWCGCPPSAFCLRATMSVSIACSGILPQSNVETWLQAFEGHRGARAAEVGSGSRQRHRARGCQQPATTSSVLAHGVRRLAWRHGRRGQALAALDDAPQFEQRLSYAALHRGNVSRAYLRLEAGGEARPGQSGRIVAAAPAYRSSAPCSGTRPVARGFVLAGFHREPTRLAQAVAAVAIFAAAAATASHLGWIRLYSHLQRRCVGGYPFSLQWRKCSTAVGDCDIAASACPLSGSPRRWHRYPGCIRRAPGGSWRRRSR